VGWYTVSVGTQAVHSILGSIAAPVLSYSVAGSPRSVASWQDIGTVNRVDQMEIWWRSPPPVHNNITPNPRHAHCLFAIFGFAVLWLVLCTWWIVLPPFIYNVANNIIFRHKFTCKTLPISDILKYESMCLQMKEIRYLVWRISLRMFSDVEQQFCQSFKTLSSSSAAWTY